MLQFIVLGLVPGTNYQISFNLILTALLGVVVLLLAFRLTRHHLTQFFNKAAELHNQLIVGSPTQTE